MKRLTLFFTILMVLASGQSRADAAERVQVQLENNTNVRAANARARNVLVAEYTLPAGSVVEVSTEKLEEPVLMRFWNALIGKTEKKHPFVKGVKLISAPGYSAREVARFNAVNRTMSLYMSKKQLDDSETLESTENRKLRTRQSSTAFRSQNVSNGLEERNNSASEKAIERLNAAHRSLKAAGAGQETCQNCDSSFTARFVNAGVPERALRKALVFYNKNRGRIRNSRYITINDLSDHSRQRRMFILDMRTGAVEKHVVAHGQGSDRGHSGYVRNFGNSNYRTPAGILLTGETYNGNHGYSLRLDGQEAQNSASRRRLIVMHPAPYVSKSWLRRYGKPGRSLGCLAVDPADSRQIINKIRGGSVVLNYAGD